MKRCAGRKTDAFAVLLLFNFITVLLYLVCKYAALPQKIVQIVSSVHVKRCTLETFDRYLSKYLLKHKFQSFR